MKRKMARAVISQNSPARIKAADDTTAMLILRLTGKAKQIILLLALYCQVQGNKKISEIGR